MIFTIARSSRAPGSTSKTYLPHARDAIHEGVQFNVGAGADGQGPQRQSGSKRSGAVSSPGLFPTIRPGLGTVSDRHRFIIPAFDLRVPLDMLDLQAKSPVRASVHDFQISHKDSRFNLLDPNDCHSLLSGTTGLGSMRDPVQTPPRLSCPCSQPAFRRRFARNRSLRILSLIIRAPF